MNIITKIIKKFFNQPIRNCMYCDKKKVIVTVRVNCDFESVCNTTLESIQLCKNCLFKMAHNEMITVSLYSLTRISVFKLLDKVDLSMGGKQSLQEMQNVLKKEREYHIQSFNS
jgi:hypothetical protein